MRKKHDMTAGPGHRSFRPTIPTSTAIWRAIVGAAMLAVVPTPGTHGQNAIGDGHALDRNLGRNTGGRNSAAAPIDFRGRNLLITNDVVGGRGFRESVGYLAEDAFRGDTGSDDTFRFRADSAWSDVNFVNFGETFQRFRFGQDAGLIEYRRDSDGTTPRTIEQQLYTPGDVVKARLQLDRFSRESSLSSFHRSVIEPSVIGGYRGEDGKLHSIQTSSIRGLIDQPSEEMTVLIGLSSFDRARLLEDFERDPESFDENVGIGFTGRYADLRIDRERESTGADDVSVDRRATARTLGDDRVPEFRRILEGVAERFDRMLAPNERPTDDDRLKSLDAEMQRLRDRIAGRGRPAETITDDPADDRLDPRDPSAPRPPGARPTSPVQPTDPESEDETSEEADDDAASRRSIDSYGTILRHGQRIDQLASTEELTRFNELMRTAEDALRDGRYFYAEQRFTRALRFIPGHPMGTAGLAHAQIGAGLYLSASLTLRSLFEFQPEMIDAQYDRALIPNHPRLLVALQKLEARVDEGKDTSSSAFLLAYLGRLIGDRDVIERGIDTMLAAAPDDELSRLLRVIWLGPETLPAAPPPAEPAEDPDAGE